MRIEHDPKSGIMLYADDHREQLLLGRLVMNVRSHDYWAVNLLEGEITIEPFNFPPRGTLSCLPNIPTCTAEIAGFRYKKQPL